MCDKKTKKLEFNHYTKGFLLKDEDLKIYGNNLINTLSDDLIKLMRMHPKTIFSFYSHDVITQEPYAVAEFVNDVLDKIYFNLNKFEGSIGIRQTNKLKDILDINVSNVDIEKIIRDELNNYFGKIKKRDYILTNDSTLEYTNSSYKLQKDFSIDLVRINNGLKSITPSHRKIYQLNKCDVGETNINDFAKSLDAKVLPFHRCTINYSVIQKSIDALNNDFYAVISAFYFPERKCKYKREFNKIIKMKEYNYRKALRLKDKALYSLIACIMNIQYLESEIK